MSLRDFDPAGLEARKARVRAAVAATQAAHPRAVVACRIEDSYRNIADSLGNDRRCLDLLERGFAELGIERNVIALRGGTDGSALSMRGVPTPNYFTGGLNFHSRFEFLPVPSFLITHRLTERLWRLAAE
jgi:tripeptide aminopeptidase